MSTPPAARMAQRDPYAALRHPEFLALAGLVLLLDSALLIQGVALSYEIYRRTHDPLALGLCGLAQALPFMVLALYGGHLADRRPRRSLIRAGLLLATGGCLVLLALAHATLPQPLWLLSAYGVIALLGLAGGLLEPAASALLTQVVPEALYANSAAWWSSVHQFSNIGGPVAAGFLYAWAGLPGCLLAALALLIGSLLLSLPLRAHAVPPATAGENLWQSLREGFAYLLRTRMLLYCMALDMFSVLFGGVTAILPVYAADILKAGPVGLGLLRAAPAAGALLAVLACAHVSPLNRPWRNLLLAAGGFALAILGFGLSRNLWLSLAALAASGACDSISMVIRGTLLQAVPPPRLRGRVMAVNSIFISASSELGAFESGVAARLLGTVPSVIAGAAATCGILLWVWRRSSALYRFKLAET